MKGFYTSQIGHFFKTLDSGCLLVTQTIYTCFSIYDNYQSDIGYLALIEILAAPIYIIIIKLISVQSTLLQTLMMILIFLTCFMSEFLQQSNNEQIYSTIYYILRILIFSDFIIDQRLLIVYFILSYGYIFRSLQIYQTSFTVFFLIGLLLFQISLQKTFTIAERIRYQDKIRRFKKKQTDLLQILSSDLEQPMLLVYQKKNKFLKNLLITESFRKCMENQEILTQSQTQKIGDLNFPQNLAIDINSYFQIMTEKQTTLNVQDSNRREPNQYFAPDQILQSYNHRFKSEFDPIVTKSCNKKSTLRVSQQQLKMDDDISQSQLINRRIINQNLKYEDQKQEDALTFQYFHRQVGDRKCMLAFVQQEQNSNSYLKDRVRFLEQQDKYKDDLLASVSHDFKTPLNCMILIAGHLESGTEDKETLKYLDIIRNNALMLKFMINDILDFSRIQKNQICINPQIFSLNAIIREVLELLQLQANEKGIQLRYVSDYAHDEVFNDPDRFKQILFNLLSNSLKFTQSGRIQVMVNDQNLRGTPQSSQNQMSNVLRVSVSDTGVGIPEHLKSKLFNMYATFDHHNGSNKHGTGLGLVITKKLVGLLGPVDRVELESEIGLGTTMSFQIFSTLNQIKNRSHRTNTIRENRVSSMVGREDLSFNRKSRSKLSILPRNSSNSSGAQIFQIYQNDPTCKVVHQKKKSLPSNSSSPKEIFVSNQIHIDDIVDINEDILAEKEKHLKGIKPLNYQHKKERSYAPIKQFLPLVSIKDLPEAEGKQKKLTQTLEVDSSDLIYQLLKQNDEQEVNILVVDDQVFNVMALKLFLKKFSRLKIDEAYDGSQAIQMIDNLQRKNEFYSCIFLDLMMGVMDGYTAGRLIRQKILSHTIPDTFLIALSGYDDDKEREKCLSIGFDAFLPKPVSLVKLIEMLDHLSYLRSIEYNEKNV